MSHTYLIDLYDLIDKRLEELFEDRPEPANENEAQFQQGRVEILQEVKQFLAEHYNRKLPRRIQPKYSR